MYHHQVGCHGQQSRPCPKGSHIEDKHDTNNIYFQTAGLLHSVETLYLLPKYDIPDILIVTDTIVMVSHKYGVLFQYIFVCRWMFIRRSVVFLDQQDQWMRRNHWTSNCQKRDMATT